MHEKHVRTPIARHAANLTDGTASLSAAVTYGVFALVTYPNQFWFFFSDIENYKTSQAKILSYSWRNNKFLLSLSEGGENTGRHPGKACKRSCPHLDEFKHKTKVSIENAFWQSKGIQLCIKQDYLANFNCNLNIMMKHKEL